MTVVEYNRKKNEILRETLGLDFNLIPESMNEEVEIPRDRLYLLDVESATHSCLYCLVWITKDKDNCYKCPMSKGGNACHSKDSTWDRYSGSRGVSMHTLSSSPAYKEMKKLISKFKREY